MKNRGQALVEFILILPVIIIILLGIIDFSSINYTRFKLEDDLEFISDLYINNKTNEISEYANKEKITYQINKESDYINLIVTKEYKVLTPGLNLILGSPYNITVSRYIYDE